ncbi:hypothetical protein DVH24_032988 [Malus domestica]|uniref:Uncharacterized protein n=1 Tax=Malus domestica TaxID=3750 RepID=A0A498IRA4_MALDO|nr:hypothetical protein DVH24_032988 [Malus domestica]
MHPSASPLYHYPVQRKWLEVLRSNITNNHTATFGCSIRNGGTTTRNPSLNLINLCVLRKLKPPQELSAALLHSVPLVVFILFLHVPLSADLKHPVVFHLHLYLLFFQPRNSTLVFTKAEFSRENSGNVESDEEEGNGKSLKGSHRLRENGSKTLLLPRRELGISDILKNQWELRNLRIITEILLLLD